MAYSHLYPEDDISIPIPNPSQHPSAPIQMLRRENYNALRDGMTGPVGGVASHAQGQMVSPMEEGEELDTSSRPRLTQEQIAILEDQFKGKPKPATDFKKHLASQIGLSLQRVNNWYQNRRAKARHQRPQERKFDVLPQDPNAHWTSSNFAFADFNLGSDQFHDISLLSHQAPSDDFMAIPNDELAELSKPYSPDLDMLHALLESGPNAGGINGLDNGLETAAKVNARLSPEANNDIIDSKSAFPLLPEWDICNWIPDPHVEIPLQNDAYITTQNPLKSHPHAMYQNSIEGFSVGNHSCQTFATNSSSEGEPGLMTPPQKTSPMPTMSHDCQSRRGSNSSELANDLNTVRLQPPQTRPVYEEMFCSPSTSDLARGSDSSPTMPQLQAKALDSSMPLNCDSSMTKISVAPRVDLASRRKRPRPPMLRPDSQRSQSYAGPLTMSPKSKAPSQGLGPSPSVRRIKSTGQNMNVVSGRVQKLVVGSAQMSPRNFQTYLDAAGLSHPQFLHRQSTDTSQASAPTFTPLTPQSPVKMELRPEVWPNYSPYVDPPAPGWDNSHDHPTHNLLEAGADVASPPITPFNIDAFPRMFVEQPLQDSFYHCPPQSAPPHQTNFFGGSSPLLAANTNHPTWMVPSSTVPFEGYQNDSTMSMRRPSQISQVGFPESQLQFMGNYHHGVPSTGLGAPNYPTPRKDLEIQVNLIPKPQGAPQARKKNYTFNNTTPKDFLQQSLYA